MSSLPNFASARHAIPITLLLLLGAAIYSNTLNSPFTFDDEPNIQENSQIRITELNLQSLYRAGFESRAPRPIAYMSFALNYYFGEYDVRGYHLFNILVHLISGALVYGLAIDLFRRRRGRRSPPASSVAELPVIAAALLAAAIFLAHPIQTQSVTYIVQRMSSLAAMFYLLALLLFICGRDRRRAVRWALWLGSTACWLLALGCKQTAATFPLIVLLYEWYFYQHLRSHWLRKRLPLLLGVALLLCVGVAAVYLSENVFFYEHRNFSLWERLLTQPRVVVQYLGLLLYPHPSRLNLAHDVPVSHSLIDPVTTLFSLAALLALFALAIRQARAQPLYSFCTLWFFIHLAIESSIFPLELMFEHRLYLPSVGFSLAVASLLHSSAFTKSRAFTKSSGAIAASIALVAVGALGLATYERNETWRDELTLWSDAVSKSPEGYRAHNNLGTALRAAGRPTEAAAHLSRSIELNPDYFPARWNLAAVAKDSGDSDALIAHLRGALALNPDHSGAHRQLALALIATGDRGGAVEHFEEAVRLYPDWPAALVGLAWVLVTHPDPHARAPGRAIELAERADALTEHSAHHILNTLASAYAAGERFEDAARIQRDLLELELAEGGPRAEVIRARLAEFERKAAPNSGR